MTQKYTMNEMLSMSESSGLPVDKFIKAAAILEEHQAAAERERRSNPEEKQKIAAYLDTLNGNVSADLPVKDILQGAGVRAVQGTRSYANRALKQALLTYDKKKS